MIVQQSAVAGLELVGNALCLDFANTVNSWRHPQRDRLTTYRDLLDWSEYLQSVPAAHLRRLRRHTTDPAAGEALAGAHRLRATIVAVFSAIAGRRDPAPGDLERLGTAYADAMRHARIAPRDPGFALSWDPADVELALPLWPVARSAGELLLSGNLERIGECPSCGWLFLDVSRNGTRRWCSMATCGSRSKMASYHDRRGNRRDQV